MHAEKHYRHTDFPQPDDLTHQEQRWIGWLYESWILSQNPYQVQDNRHIELQPPFIVVANHDVARGEKTGLEIDAALLIDFIRKKYHIQPSWIADTGNQVLKDTIPVPAFLIIDKLIQFRANYYNLIQFNSSVPSFGTANMKRIKRELRDQGIIGLFARTLQHKNTKRGYLALSQYAGVGQTGVPIQPIRIDKNTRHNWDDQHPKFTLTLQPPLIPHFSGKRIHEREQRYYDKRLDQAIFEPALPK